MFDSITTLSGNYSDGWDWTINETFVRTWATGSASVTLTTTVAAFTHATGAPDFPTSWDSFVRDTDGVPAGAPVMSGSPNQDMYFDWDTSYTIVSGVSGAVTSKAMPNYVYQGKLVPGVSAAREFFLLRELGADLSGAVRVSALGSIVDSPTGLAAELPAPVATDEPVRFSLAGLQLKFSAEASGNGWRLPVRGMGGRWLLKVPDEKYKSVPLNEWAMMTLARRIGLDVAQVRLIDLSEVVGLPQEFEMPESKALLVERFDRQEPGPRIHTVNFLQVLDKHPDGHDIKYRAASYNSIAKVVYSLGGMADFEEFVRRLVFNIWAGNSDAHLKTGH